MKQFVLCVVATQKEIKEIIDKANIEYRLTEAAEKARNTGDLSEYLKLRRELLSYGQIQKETNRS